MKLAQIILSGLTTLDKVSQRKEEKFKEQTEILSYPIKTTSKGYKKAKKAIQQDKECSFDDFNELSVILILMILIQNIKALQKKINSHYYESDNETDNSKKVGSIGRGTAIKGISDLDMLYEIPDERIKGRVFQDGFRPELLSKLKVVRHRKKIEFYIKYNSVPKPYRVFWKVRNVGPQAEKLDQIRGQIEESKFETKTEPITFDDPHFVECYIIIDGVCVARDKVDVPIKLDSYSGYFIEQKKA